MGGEHCVQSTHVLKIWQVLYIRSKNRCLMLSWLIFGVKKYNVCYLNQSFYKDMHFQYISHHDTFYVNSTAKYAVIFKPGH